MTTLDPRGLEATEWLVREFAHQQNRAIVGQPINARAAAEKFIRAYLDAMRPSCEADRIAVVMNETRELVCWGVDKDDLHETMWVGLEGRAVANGMPGPFARQIVRCHLRRPDPPAEIEGVVE